MKKIDITKLWLKVILLLNSFGSRISLVLITAVGGCPVVLYCENIIFSIPSAPTFYFISFTTGCMQKGVPGESKHTLFVSEDFVQLCNNCTGKTKIADFLEIFQEGRGER